MLTIAVPLAGGRFSTHFGGAENFGLYKVDKSSNTIVSRETTAPPPHERGVFPAWLNQQRVNVVLAGGMGPRAHDILARYGIEAILGVDGDDPEELVKAYLDGLVSDSGSLCNEPGFHDCGHHDH